MPLADVLNGGCLCGAVRFCASSAPRKVMNCHCSMCRRHSGAAFMTYALFDADQVRFNGTPPADYRSSAAALRSHCGTCGSPVKFTYDEEPGNIYLPAGAFDNADWLSPSENWFVSGCLPWVHLDDDLPRFLHMPL